MTRGIVTAFFYKNSYFLLPDGYVDETAFLQALDSSAESLEILALILKEHNDVIQNAGYELGVCIAPYFIVNDSAEKEVMVIDAPSEVYPVQVELLSQQEYNDRLRSQVSAYCSGCNRFGSLTKNDRSLSGHFDEMSLNGVCVYRYETRSAPNCFYAGLDALVHHWARWPTFRFNEEYALDDFRADLKLRYSDARLVEADGQHTLYLSVKKSSMLLTALTDILSDYVKKEIDPEYNIALQDRMECSEETISLMLSAKKIASTRKNLKKYGVAIGIVEFDPEYNGQVSEYLHELVRERLLVLWTAAPGRYTCLLTGEPQALMRLRYAAPMMQAAKAQITVYSAFKTARYQLTYDLPETVLDATPPENPKVKKLTKKQLKAEEGMVLKHRQVKSMFDYVSDELAKHDCDHTPRFAAAWLRENLNKAQYDAAVEELQNMGGFCDCEVLMNCYQDYELEDLDD